MADDKDIRYVILLTPIRPERLTEQLVRDHVAHLQHLERDNTLELCGPFPEAGGGMVIVRVSTEEAARAIADADPFVTSGAETYELRRWELSHSGNKHLGMAD